MNISNIQTIGAKDDATADLVLSAATAPVEPPRGGANRLWGRVARECEAMAEHAYSVGLNVPVEVAKPTDEALSAFGPSGLLAPPPPRQRIEAYAAGEDRSGGVEPRSVALLSKAHAALALLIKPATPESVLLLTEERRKHSMWYAFGPLPIVRQMLGLALLSLLILLLISTSSEINADNMGATLLQLQGIPLLKVEVFLLSAASLGSCFQNLQQINAYISTGTYDPKFQSSYWTRWVMGLISGIVVSQLVFELIHSAVGPKGDEPALVGQPVLALLGGYSVDVVHGILSHVINSVGKFFHLPRDFPGEMNTVDTAETAAARARLTLASEVSDLRGGLADDVNSEEILRRLDDLIRRNIAVIK
jgi:hypothetical protein